MTVLIPTHGRPTLLKRTLESLQACTLPDSFYELVVIENGSHAGAEQVVAELPEALKARYMHRKRGNKSYALNEALETIEDGLVIFFDDDVRVGPNVLQTYAENARGVRKGVFFGGPADVDYEHPPPLWLKEYLPPSVTGWGLGGKQEQNEFKHFLGFNWAAFVEDLRSLDGFSENFGPGTPQTGQETDMQQRLLGAGVEQQFVPGAIVWHYVPKERCTPRWALHRHYRNGMTEGALRHYNSPMFMGIPKWTIRETGRSLYMAARDILRGTRVAAFSSAVNICRYLGVIRGVHQRVNHTAA